MPELNLSLNLVSIVTIILNLCISVDGEIVASDQEVLAALAHVKYL